MAGKHGLSLLRLLLAACCLSSAAGCSFESAARDDQASLQLGMTADEVRETLGEPARITTGDSGQAWTYVYHPGDGSLAVFTEVVIVLGSLGTVVAVLFSGRGWPESSSRTSASPEKPRSWRFSVRFGPDGRVAEISDVW